MSTYSDSFTMGPILFQIRIFNYVPHTKAFHCSEMASLSDGTSGQSKNHKKVSKFLAKASQITYFILVWIYRWIRFNKKNNLWAIFWVLNPFFSYEHQLSELPSKQGSSPSVGTFFPISEFSYRRGFVSSFTCHMSLSSHFGTFID